MADNATLVLSVEATEAIKDIAKFSKQTTEAGKKSQKSFNKMSQALKSIDFKSTFLVGAEAIRGFNAVASKLTGSLSSIIDAASTQEDAINSLNTSLALSGEYSEAAAQGFQDWASALQAASTAGDEQLLQQAALAKSFGATNEQAKQITEAALELSAATGKSLEEATRQVSKTLGGFAGELGEVNPAIKALTQEQLKAGEAAKILLDQYGGSAASKLNTFSGAIAQTSNTFGDLLESLGALVTENPVIIEGVKIINGVFQELIVKVKQNSGTISKIITAAFKLMVKAVGPVIKAIGFIVKALLAIPYVLTTVTVAIADFVASALKKFKYLADAINSAFGVIGVDIDVTSFAESIREGALDIGYSMETVMDGVESGFQAVAESADQVSARIDKVNENIGASKTAVKNVEKAQETFTSKFDKVLKDFTTNFASKIGGLLGSFFSGLSAGAKASADAGKAAREEARKENERRQFEAQKEGITLDPSSLIDVEKAGVEAEKKAQKEQGTELSKKTVSGLSSAIAESFLPGLGQVVGPFIELLTQDPSQVRAMVESFAKALPEIINVMAENIGPIVEILAENADEIIIALVEAMPKVAESLIMAAPRIIASLVSGFFNVARTLVADAITALGTYISDKFSLNLSAAFDVFKPATEFLKTIADSMQPIVQVLEQIRGLLDTGGDFVDNTLSSLADFGSNPVGTTATGLQKVGGGLSSAFGLSSGGTVPGTGNRDTVPAMLTPGEVVVPKDDVTKLRSFLDSQTSSGGNDMQTALLSQMVTLLSQPQTVSTSAEINGEAFADIILQLNRNNQRLA